jgi:hypothetical protein
MATITKTICDWCGSEEDVVCMELCYSPVGPPELQPATSWDWEYDLCLRCRQEALAVVQEIERMYKK